MDLPVNSTHAFLFVSEGDLPNCKCTPVLRHWTCCKCSHLDMTKHDARSLASCNSNALPNKTAYARSANASTRMLRSVLYAQHIYANSSTLICICPRTHARKHTMFDERIPLLQSGTGIHSLLHLHLLLQAGGREPSMTTCRKDMN